MKPDQFYHFLSFDAKLSHSSIKLNNNKNTVYKILIEIIQISLCIFVSVHTKFYYQNIMIMGNQHTV